MTKMLNTEPTKISLEVPKIILQQTHFSIILLDTDHSSTQEEVVLVHVDFAGCLQDLGAHLEGEEQLVPLKQTATGVPTSCNYHNLMSNVFFLNSRLR